MRSHHCLLPIEGATFSVVDLGSRNLVAMISNFNQILMHLSNDTQTFQIPALLKKLLPVEKMLSKHVGWKKKGAALAKCSPAKTEGCLDKRRVIAQPETQLLPRDNK